MVIHLVCAARPNFMKIAPLYHALRKEKWAQPVIVHTGQHYDPNMSGAFFEDLGLPAPDIHLGVGSGSHAEQTGSVMMAYEKILYEKRPDLVVVVGDVNSTMAATIAASKVVYPSGHSTHISNSTKMNHATSRANNHRRPLVAHLEAGLRSFDRSMPEEINRVITDAVADVLWTPSRDAVENLLKEGIAPEKIQLVGNIMIDSLEMLRGKIERQNSCSDFGLLPKGYGVVTLHRPSNVDDPAVLEKLCGVLGEIAESIPLIFPVHPRTRKNIGKNRLLATMANHRKLLLPEPLNYIRFMNLVFHCRFVITDSGGIQEETTHLHIPCLTIRENTERPITLTYGTNQLCDGNDLKEKIDQILRNPIQREGKVIEYWDGKTAERIVSCLKALKRRKNTRKGPSNA